MSWLNHTLTTAVWWYGGTVAGALLERPQELQGAWQIQLGGYD